MSSFIQRSTQDMLATKMDNGRKFGRWVCTLPMLHMSSFFAVSFTEFRFRPPFFYLPFHNRTTPPAQFPQQVTGPGGWASIRQGPGCLRFPSQFSGSGPGGYIGETVLFLFPFFFFFFFAVRTGPRRNYFLSSLFANQQISSCGRFRSICKRAPNCTEDSVIDVGCQALFAYQHIQLHSNFLKESCWHVPRLFHPFTRKARSSGPVAMLLRKGELFPWHQQWPCMEQWQGLVG